MICARVINYYASCELPDVEFEHENERRHSHSLRTMDNRIEVKSGWKWLNGVFHFNIYIISIYTFITCMHNVGIWVCGRSSRDNVRSHSSAFFLSFFSRFYFSLVSFDLFDSAYCMIHIEVMCIVHLGECIRGNIETGA